MPFEDIFSASAGPSFLCTRCHETIKPKSVVKGSFIVELGCWLSGLLWLPLILLGAGYSVWRLTSRHKECPQCSSVEFVPIDSPRAREIRAAMVSKPT